jgi:hypothetical protein
MTDQSFFARKEKKKEAELQANGQSNSLSDIHLIPKTPTE